MGAAVKPLSRRWQLSPEVGSLAVISVSWVPSRHHIAMVCGEVKRLLTP